MVYDTRLEYKDYTIVAQALTTICPSGMELAPVTQFEAQPSNGANVVVA